MNDNPESLRGWPIVGHEWAVRQLQLAVTHGDVPHALLFTGPESVGKLTLARTVAAALLCKGEVELPPCGACLSCRKLNSGNHPDFMVVEAEAKSGSLKIEQIRDVERFLSLTPNESRCKIALIADFERATIGAANALLKTLEEPPGYAHLMLLAQDAELLLPTIVSRSRQISLRPLGRQQVEDALSARWGVAPEPAERLARISGGRIGWAVRAATDPAYEEQMTQALTTMLDILQQDVPTRFETAQALTREDAHLEEALEYWLTGWRDVLLVQTENVARMTYREHAATLERLAREVGVARTLAMIQTLEKAQQSLRRNVNTQLLLENLLLDFPAL